MITCWPGRFSAISRSAGITLAVTSWRDSRPATGVLPGKRRASSMSSSPSASPYARSTMASTICGAGRPSSSAMIAAVSAARDSGLEIIASQLRLASSLPVLRA